jgi:EAL domain-containing protein (putative c-di-GMP-specific phosphodiesterase class I)
MPEARFRTALDSVLNGETQAVLHYQPIVDLRRGRVVGYEALSRFPSPPPLSPEEWFRSAQVRGKRLQLEERMCRMALEGRDLLPPDTFLTINVSPLFLLSEEWDNLLTDVRDLSRIVLEVTEGERVLDYELFRSRLERVRNAGGHIAVDDTGSGYASLKHVMELRPQFVKLDRFFIGGCEADPAKSALISMIGEAADRMDAWMVAEGVETQPELFELIRHRVPLAQGYYLGRPSPNMLPLRKDTGTLIRERSEEMPYIPGLHPHLELVKVYADLESAAKGVMSGNTTGVVVDSYGRPMHLVEMHPLAGCRTLHEPMRVQVSSTVSEVLRRALSRPASHRFDPLVAISEKGDFLGVVRVDHLTNAIISRN